MRQMSQLGWQVIGIEPNPMARQVARASGLEVLGGALEDVQLPEAEFDAVTLIHVVEHLRDPVMALTRIYAAVKPSGELVIRTPNIESVGYRLFRDHWYHLDVPRHRFMFSTKSLCSMVEHCGFLRRWVMTASPAARDLYLAGLLLKRRGQMDGYYRRYSIRARPLERVAATGFCLVSAAARLLGWPCGEEIVAVFEKPS